MNWEILKNVVEVISTIIEVLLLPALVLVNNYVRGRRKFEEESKMDRATINIKIGGLKEQFGVITSDHKDLKESITSLDRTLAELNITMLNVKEILTDTREELRNKQDK